MAVPPTDAEVVARVLAGDTDAFGILVDRYQDEFAAFAKYMLGSMDEAADVMQESLVRAYKSLRRCRDRANFKGWLFRIVSNQCRTQLNRRKARRTEPLEDVGAVLQAEHDPGMDAEHAELRRRVHEALQELPTDQREALVLRYVEGLGVQEMAEIIGASVSAVKMRLLRGREALRARFEGVAL
jgi:RNA polymerase sigma-70 factor (ECF subfamily)